MTQPAHWPPPLPAAGQATPQAIARHQELVEELCAACIRAISGEADLHFRGRRLHRGRRALPLFAPHLAPSLAHDDAGSWRGAADGQALRLKLSDAALHLRLSPAEPVERLLFGLLEQLRCEALAPAAMPGVAHNLRHRFEAWSRAFHRSRLTESTRGLLVYTVAQICRARVTGTPVMEETEDLLEATRAAIVPLIGHALAGLRRCRGDQAAYAPHALAIARGVAQMLATAAAQEAEAPEDEAPALARFSLLLDFDREHDALAPAAAMGRSALLAQSPGGYRVFTRAHDRVLPAATLVRRELLADYRARLDARIARQGVHPARLARELQAALALPQADGWHTEQEEGRIDGRLLARLVASPVERRLFRTEREQPVADCAVTLLLDCSASMKENAETVAMLVDVLARALEMVGVRCEILGFTTGAWNGGRAHRDWLRNGRPAHPGRLNELNHLVFKDAATPWRRARAGVAALLKADLFREGVDGEALQWAAGRLAALDVRRRLLLVFSDGCPMDSATRLANDSAYLEHHLQDVAQHIEQHRQVELYGIGLGLDMSAWYSACHVLDPVEMQAGNGPWREIAGLIRRGARR